jgi:hypothetical protein
MAEKSSLDRIQTQHSLVRTSRIGDLFIGRCVLCGTEGLTAKEAREYCINPTGVTVGASILDAIEGETDVR